MGTWDVDSIQDDKLIDIEGDCYWCFCKLMDRVEEIYTKEQPGEQKVRPCVGVSPASPFGRGTKEEGLVCLPADCSVFVVCCDGVLLQASGVA